MGLYKGSYTRAAAVTESDTTLITSKALWIGGTGDLVFIPLDNWHDGITTPLTLTAVPAGTLLPIAVAKVMEASTVTEVVALY